MKDLFTSETGDIDLHWTRTRKKVVSHDYV